MEEQAFFIVKKSKSKERIRFYEEERLEGDGMFDPV